MSEMNSLCFSSIKEVSVVYVSISDLHIHRQSNDDGYSKPSLRRLNVTRSPYKKCNFAFTLAMRVNILDI